MTGLEQKSIELAITELREKTLGMKAKPNFRNPYPAILIVPQAFSTCDKAELSLFDLR